MTRLRRTLGRLSFLLLLASAVLSGEADGQVFVSGGVVTPNSPDVVTDIYRSGYSIAVGFALESGSFPFARLRPFGSFNKFRTDPEPFEAQFENIDEVEGGDMPLIYAGADLQLRLPFAAFTPYIAPAVGYAVFSIDDIIADGIRFNLREEVGGLALGLVGGFAYGVSRNYEVFAEGQYVRAFLDGRDRTFVPVRMGLAFSFDY